MKKHSQLFVPILGASAIGLVLSAGALAQVPAGTAPTGPAVTRFAVTHLHALSQCIGYLYISDDRVRFEVVQPQSDKNHSFDLARSDIQGVQQWILLGVVQNSAEIRTVRGNYHFLLLPDNADLANTQPRQWGVRNAVPVSTLIAAFQGSTLQTPAPGVSATPAPAPGAAAPAGAPPQSSATPAVPMAPMAPAPPSAPAATMPNVTGSSSLSEYVFTAPPGWSTNRYPDGIVLTSPTYNTGERCLLQMWPLHQTGADLLSEAGAAFQGIFKTYELRDRTSDGMPMPTVMIRGSSGQGWDYVILKRGVGKPNGPGGPFATLQGFVLVARLNGNVAAISGISKESLVSSCLGELVGNVWPRFFYSLRFRDWPAADQGPAIAGKLTGTWTTASGSVADQWQFDANGRYGKAAAVQNYNRVSSTEVLRTTQAFFGNGAYALQENTITLTPDEGKGPRDTGWIRVEEESTDGGRTWNPVLYLLRVSAVDGKDYEVRYRR